MQVIINREELNEALELFLKKKGLAFTNISARVHGAGSGATIDLDSEVPEVDKDEIEENTTETDIIEPEADASDSNLEDKEEMSPGVTASIPTIQGFGQ